TAADVLLLGLRREQSDRDRAGHPSVRRVPAHGSRAALSHGHTLHRLDAAGDDPVGLRAGAGYRDPRPHRSQAPRLSRRSRPRPPVSTRRQFLRFALAGVVGFVVDAAVLYALLALGLGYYLGRVFSFLAAAFTTWQINRRHTFAARADGRWLRE